MPDVLVIHPGGRSQIYVNPSTASSSETILTNNDGTEQTYISPSNGSVILSPNPVVVSNSPTEIATLQAEMAQALNSISTQAAFIATLQAEQAAEIPENRLQYSPSAPSSTWIINHNFGYVPNIELLINGEQAFTQTDVSSTTATLIFPSPQTGVAILT